MNGRLQIAIPVDWRSYLFSIFVSNLCTRVSKRALWDAFSDYGKVADVFIQRNNKTQGPTTFAFVRFWKEKDARFALEKANFRFLEGIRIRVSSAKNSRRTVVSNKSKYPLMKQVDERRTVVRESKVDGRSFKEVVVLSRNCNGERGEPAKQQVRSDTNQKDAQQSTHSGKAISVKVAHLVDSPSNADMIGEKDFHKSPQSNLVVEKEQISTWQSRDDFDLEVDIPSEDMAWLEKCVVACLKPNILLIRFVK
ncbi:hypothetical protein COLO4_22653 [Corchorus olitorius]|uniref:RRM domain-containing protein n=1 Tax=Corchorus olitorius TaxID=93759 RepID=A0A1R3IKS8_9ROSI|nr:hypothetical protein COLO4_22653 [Corchorus olitorius]